MQGELLDAWENDLVHPGRFQTERERNEIFKAFFAVENEAPGGLGATLTPGKRGFNISPDYSHALHEAIIKRFKQIDGLEPDYVRAVDEHLPFEDPEDRGFFLAGAVLLHDLFTLHYEMEDFIKMIGTP